ncbi:hypothetical protein [Halorubellus salinus]|uniref:hypothetical protein n=1 Tax=Halorubellus salinus TaxID=755309 RepID=UPI001D067430|nr:hypothetical protein [Halorubellus salinus]
MRRVSRRRVLRASAIGAVASTSSLAGCTRGVFDRSVDPPSFTSRIVTDDWLQAADVTPEWRLQHVRYVDVDSLAEHVERFPVLDEWVASAPLLEPAFVRDLVVTIREYQYAVARLRDDEAALRAADDVWETFEPMDADGYWSRVRGEHVLQVVGDGVLLSMGARPDADASVVERRDRLERRAVRVLAERPSTFATETAPAERLARVAALADDPTVARLSTRSAYVPEVTGSAEAFAVGDRTTDLRAVAL